MGDQKGPGGGPRSENDLQRKLRTCFGHFATGVTVVTCDTPAAPHGITVNAFTSVSLDPPLALVAIDCHTRACTYLAESCFTINILTRAQDGLARHFAGGTRAPSPIPWTPGKIAPRLAGCLAYLECSPWRSYEGGDHTLYLGRIEELEFVGGEPLIFYLGTFSAAEDVQGKVLPFAPVGLVANAGWVGENVLYAPAPRVVGERSTRE
jgi:flavin reductase (DIM6/NTAB) family NADH-FMN oxidoreductase RutF